MTSFLNNLLFFVETLRGANKVLGGLRVAPWPAPVAESQLNMISCETKG